MLNSLKTPFAGSDRQRFEPFGNLEIDVYTYLYCQYSIRTPRNTIVYLINSSTQELKRLNSVETWYWHILQFCKGIWK